MYTASFIYTIRMNAGVPRWSYVTFVSYALGMTLGMLLLPKAIAFLGAGVRRRTLPLAGILAAAFALRLPGMSDPWSMGFLRDCVTVAGHGVITSGVFMLFFATIPERRRGLAYGFAMSAGLAWWRIFQSVLDGTTPEAAAAEWYNFLYAAQTLTTLAMAVLIVCGFALRAPESLPPPTASREPDESPDFRRVKRLAGALFLFYLANGLLGIRLFVTESNQNAQLYAHILAFFACPLIGLLIDECCGRTRTVLLVASVFLMLAPSLNVLSDSPLLYSIIHTLGLLTQFAMLTVVVTGLSRLGSSLRWFGAVLVIQFLLRFVSFFTNFIFRKIPGLTEIEVSVFFATVAAIAFHFAARKVDGDSPAGDSPADGSPADIPPVSDVPPAGKDADREKLCREYGLTPRERDVAQLFSLGKTPGEISRELHISEHTVKTHFRNIMGKMRVPNRNALLIKLFQR